MFERNIPPASIPGKPGRRLTRAEVEAHRRFDAKIARLLALADDPVIYDDTIAISTFRPVPPDIFAELERINPGKVIPEQEGRWQERWDRGPLLPPRRVRLPSILRMHQPSSATYAFLVKHFPDHKIARLDLSLDFPTKSQSQADADLIDNELIRKHVIMLWRRADWEMQEHEEGGTYYRAHGKGDPPQRGRDLLAYVAVKITDQPAAHLDCRFFAAETCNRLLGIHTAQDLLDLTDLDRRAVIRHYTKLAYIRWDHAAIRFEKAVQKSAQRFRVLARRARQPLLAAFTTAGVRRRLEHAIARQLIGEDDDTFPAWNEFPNFPAQKLFDADVCNIFRKSAITLPTERIA